ncbi:MAG: type secretion system protein [Pseudomonadota bacterium]|jgi:general secretion pathway protein L
MTEKRLIFLSPMKARSAPWLLVDGAGGVLGRGIVTPGDDTNNLPSILVVPGTDILARWIELPDCTPAQAHAAAAIMLEDSLGAPRGTTHIALGANEGGRRMVCAVDKVRMRSWLDAAAALGITPEAIVPDYLLLPQQSETALALAMGDHVAVRGDDFAFSAEADLASLLLGARAVRWMDGSEDRDRLLSEGAGALSFNLLQQDFAPKVSWSAYLGAHRRIAVLAALVLVSPLLLSIAQFLRNEVGAVMLGYRAHAVAAEALSPWTVDDPVAFLRSRAESVRANEEFLLSTAALFQAVSAVQGVELESLTYLQGGVLQTSVLHGSVTAINELSQSLAASGLVAEADAAVPGVNNRLSTRLSLRPGL